MGWGPEKWQLAPLACCLFCVAVWKVLEARWAAPFSFCSVARTESGASASRDLLRGPSVLERMLLNVTCFLGTITFPDVPGNVFRIKSLLPCGKEAEDSRRKLLVCLSSVMASLLCTGRPASILFLIFGFYPVTLRSSS